DGPSRTQNSLLKTDCLITVFVGASFLGSAAKLEVRAIGAPGFGIEARSGDGQHVSVTAAFRTLVRGTTPPARFELHDSRRALDCCWASCFVVRIARERIGHSTLHSMRTPMDFSRFANACRSSGATSVIARPGSSARPVRPTRCT